MTHPLRIRPYRAGDSVSRDAHATQRRMVDPDDGSTLAAKLYDPTGGPEPRLLSRWHEEFADEVRRLQRHSTDLVPIEASGRAGELAWVLTAMPSGEALDGILGGRPISTCRARAILGGVAAALDRLHAGKLVHRSLTPSNVIIGDDGSVLFADTLLLGRFAEAVVAGELSLERAICAAPEAVLGYRQRAASNQYSLAVMAYRALTGFWPFAAGNAIDYAHACICQEASAPGSRRQGIPPKVDAIIARALAKEPDERYPTCTAFVEELSAALPDTRASLSLAARPFLRKRLRALRKGALDLLAKVTARARGRRDRDHFMPEAYLAEWRLDAARAGRAAQPCPDRRTPEWTLDVQSAKPGWLRVDGRYAGAVPAEISVPGRQGKRVLVELMRDGAAVANTELQLHPLMNTIWQPQED